MNGDCPFMYDLRIGLPIYVWFTYRFAVATKQIGTPKSTRFAKEGCIWLYRYSDNGPYVT